MIYLWHPRQSQTYSQLVSISSSVFIGNVSVLIGVWTGCETVGLVGVAFICDWLIIGAGGNGCGVDVFIIGCGIGFGITYKQMKI